MLLGTDKKRFFRLGAVLAIILCINICLLIMHPAHALASTNSPITITNETSKVTFPKNIDFSMSAQDSGGSITQATLFILYNGNNQDLHQVSPSTPLAKATFHWIEDTSSDNFAPTGTQVSYYWKVVDDSGNTYIGKTETFQLTDTRFSWQQLGNSSVTIHWYAETAGFGQQVLNIATQDVKRISNDLGNGPTQPVSLWLYKTDEDFHGSLPANSYEWVGGIAYPKFNVCEISAQSTDDNTLIRDMPHELTHLVFHQVIGPQALAPTWFDEGLAVYHQVYHEPEMLLIFKNAEQNHTLLRLSTISMGFPSDANKAYLAYGESWQLLDYMYRTFGHKKMVALFNDIKNPQNDFGQALQQAIGMDQSHLENQWYLSIGQPALLQPAVATPTPAPQQATQPITINTTQNNTPWLLLIVLLLVLVPGAGIGYLIVYQKRSREKALVLQQAQSILNSTFYTQQQGMGNPQQMGYRPDPNRPYTDPRSYGQPDFKGPYSPYSQSVPYTPRPQQRPNGMQPHVPETPQPPQTERGVPRNDDGQQPSQTPNQEYLNKYPDKQAPQE